MTRVPFAVAVFCLLARHLSSQVQVLDLELVHVVGDRSVATTRLSVSASEVRGSGATDQTDLIAILQFDGAAAFSRYDREVKSRRDGMVLSAVSVAFDGTRYSLRERGPMGTRTKSISGPPIDACVDAAFPEALIPLLIDPRRSSLRVLMLPEMIIKTVVIEERAHAARHAPLDGGGVTVFRDGAGGFQRLALPGPEGRVVVLAGAESRPARPADEAEAVVMAPAGRLRAVIRASRGPGRGAGVVLLADAGARDGDGAGGGSRIGTLRLFADALGVATIRADKRGVGGSANADADLAMLVADARSLLDELARHPSVDPSRLFVAGHGEGAVVAAELARRHPEAVLGVVMLASPARPLGEALEARLRVRLSAAGQLPEAIDGAIAALRAEIAALLNLAPHATLAPGQALLRDLVTIDPARQIASLRQPVLVMHASGDREIPAAQVALMRASLAFSSDRVRFEMVDGATHELVTAPEGAGPGPRDFPEGADVARELHPAFPARARAFIEEVSAAASRPAK